MKLENQVVSLELAKKLKELGVKQESYASWFHSSYDSGSERVDGGFIVSPSFQSPTMGNMTLEKICSAYTVAELGEMLKGRALPDYYVNGNEWSCFFNRSKSKIDWIHADTEADARAKMLIYLIENKLIET